MIRIPNGPVFDLKDRGRAVGFWPPRSLFHFPRLFPPPPFSRTRISGFFQWPATRTRAHGHRGRGCGYRAGNGARPGVAPGRQWPRHIRACAHERLVLNAKFERGGGFSVLLSFCNARAHVFSDSPQLPAIIDLDESSATSLQPSVYAPLLNSAYAAWLCVLAWFDA